MDENFSQSKDWYKFCEERSIPLIYASSSAVYGNSTISAVQKAGLTVNIGAPTPESPSMSMALENYLQKSNKR